MFIPRREFNEIKKKVVVYRDTNCNLQLENETLRIALNSKEENIKDKIRALDDTQIRIIEQLKELVEVVALLSAKVDKK